MSAPTIPAGMVPWAGGDTAPDDWDGGPVLLRTRTGQVYMSRQMSHVFWGRAGDARSDVVAYTPRQPTRATGAENARVGEGNPTPASPREGEDRAREVLAGHSRLYAGEPHDATLLTAQAAVRAMLAYAAERDASQDAEVAELTAEIERLRGLLIDPGSPPWEDARGLLVAELRKSGRKWMADLVANKDGVDVPSHIALDLIAMAGRDNARLRTALERIAAHPSSSVITSDVHGDRETFINIARAALSGDVS